MPKIRVLIADDSVVVRRMLTDVLSGDPEIEVAGAAANGRIALAKLSQLNPDVVIMDVEMPELNGLETLALLRRDWPRLPVIMFSSLTERGAVTTLDALSLGATDYITKPASVGSVVPARQQVRDELIPRIKALVDKARTDRERLATTGTVTPGVAAFRGAVEAITIGVSTGGPNALATLLHQIPADLPVPMLIVQHMPPLFTRLLAGRLGANTALSVAEASPGMAVEPGHVYIAPGNFHMVVAREAGEVRIHTNQGPLENSCRPSVDPLFRSGAEVYGSRMLAVVLTGMGQDGLRGSQVVREAGGQILAQDEPSSVVWGMPGFVARAGLADQVLPLDQIAGEIVRRVATGGAVGPVPASRS